MVENVTNLQDARDNKAKTALMNSVVSFIKDILDRYEVNTPSDYESMGAIAFYSALQLVRLSTANKDELKEIYSNLEDVIHQHVLAVDIVEDTLQ